MPENIIGLRSKISCLAVLLLLLPLSVVAQIPLASWPFAHYDNSRTGFNPNEFALGPNNVHKLTEVWTFPAAARRLTRRPLPMA